MKSIDELVLEAIKEKDIESTIKQQVSYYVERALDESIKDIFGQYSIFAKKLKEELEKQLEVNLSVINLSTYNEIINREIENILKEQTKELSEKNIKKLLEKLTIGNLKEEYTLSELLEELLEETYLFNGEKGITLHINKKHFENTVIIYLDEIPNTMNYKCNYEIILDIKTNKIISLEINNEEIDKIIFSKERFCNLIAQIFLTGKKIILDKGFNEKNYETIREEYEEE